MGLELDPARARPVLRMMVGRALDTVTERATAERVAHLLRAMTLEIQLLARACGKANVHDLEPEDLRALTLEASMICGIPLVGTNKVFGGGPGWQEGPSGAASTARGRRSQP